jgi:hypothetical protein
MGSPVFSPSNPNVAGLITHLNASDPHLHTAITRLTACIISLSSAGASGLYSMSTVNGVAYPNLSQGLIQYIRLSENILLANPSGFTKPLIWTLVIDQDTVGGWGISLADGYYGDFSGLITFPGTRSQINLLIDGNQDSSINSLVTGYPAP